MARNFKIFHSLKYRRKSYDDLLISHINNLMSDFEPNPLLSSDGLPYVISITIYSGSQTGCQESLSDSCIENLQFNGTRVNYKHLFTGPCRWFLKTGQFIDSIFTNHL